jgi:hypothetical protein
MKLRYSRVVSRAWVSVMKGKICASKLPNGLAQMKARPIAKLRMTKRRWLAKSRFTPQIHAAAENPNRHPAILSRRQAFAIQHVSAMF